MPVQYSYTSTPPVGRTACTSLIACTVQLYLYSPYRPYSLYKPQCLYSTAIPPCLYRGVLYSLHFGLPVPCMSSPSILFLHSHQQYICICNWVSIENRACICRTCAIERLPDWAPCSEEQCCWLGHWLACQLIVLKSVNNWVSGSTEQEMTHVLKLQEVPLSAILVKCWSA